MTLRRHLRTLVAGLGICVGGCAAAPPARSVPWPDVTDGRTLLSEHYALHTNLADADYRRELVRTMERSHALYERLAGPRDGKADRLDGYVFAYRDEWADFTRRTAGAEAEVYLLIARGGYARERSFATFDYGRPQTLSACRHEGFHQYVAAGFARRPPPFLEEGLATLFEEGFENDNLARPLDHGKRHLQIAVAVRRQRTWPLATLLTMNAGDVVGADGPQIETFYAQAWALARFLTSDRRYRAGLRPLLRAYADGEVAADAALFGQHFGVPLATLADDFDAYQRELAGIESPR